MVNPEITEKLKAVCDKHIQHVCMASGCPLVRWMCYAYQSPNIMYYNCSPLVRNKIVEVLDNEIERVSGTGKQND